MNNKKSSFRGYKFKKKKKGFKVDGVKIQNAKPRTVDNIKFKSGLEAFCYTKLKENGIHDFQYEEHTFVLQDKFVSSTSGLEIYNKTFQEKNGSKKMKSVFGEVTNNIRAITYTPDFVHLNEDKTGWIIETKGFRTGEFTLKWKMFKKFLKENKYIVSLYTPSNQTQVAQAIDSVKSKYYI